MYSKTPSKKHLMKALLRKADRKKKTGESFRPRMLLKMPAPYISRTAHISVTPALYRRLHLGKRKEEAKNGS